jgi:hypothetical protein
LDLASLEMEIGVLRSRICRGMTYWQRTLGMHGICTVSGGGTNNYITSRLLTHGATLHEDTASPCE